jgi:probable O-glycosylation ligase (exosortase A-associated)
MPYKSRPFDYEPVTRRGKKVRRPGRELDEEFAAPQSRLSEEARADEWITSAAELPVETDSNLLWPRRTGDAAGQTEAAPAEKKERWILKRGHAISFVGLFLFTLVVFFRPYDLFAVFVPLKTLAFWIAITTLVIFIPTQLNIEGRLSLRLREVNLLLLLALIGLLGVPFAINRAEAWESFVQFLKIVLMFVVMVNVIRTEGRLKALIFVALSSACLVSVGALRDYRLGQLKMNGERVTGIIGGMFGNPNDMALYLVMMIPLAFSLLLIARGLTRKIIYGIFILVMIAANLVTFSRGGFFGLVCVLGVLAWKIGRRHRLSVLVVSLLAGVSLFFLLPSGLVERFAAMFGLASNQSAADSAISRWELLLRSLGQTVRHPLLGLGMSNFHIVSIHEQVSHNAYTQVSSEMGIIAFILYVMFMIIPLRRLRQIERETLAARHNSHFYYLSVGLQASLIGYMVSSFFVSVAYLYYLYYPVGFAICLYLMYQTSQAKEAGARRVGAETHGRGDEKIEPGVPAHAVLEC